MTPSSEAPQNLGGYTHANVTRLEGKYLCVRPAFSASGLINAYLVTIRWDDANPASYLRNKAVSMRGTRNGDASMFRTESHI